MSISTIIIKGLQELEHDPNAQKIFGPQQNSMILGTSNVARLDGQIISNEVNKEEIIFDSIFNFSFHLGASPYGPSYIESVNRKLNTEKSEKQRIFILCVDPWALSAPKSGQYDSLPFYESKTFIAFKSNQKIAKLNYFKSYFSNPYYTFFLPKKKIDVQPERPSNSHIQKHLKGKIEAYRTFKVANDELP